MQTRHGIFILLRRLRVPLLALIGVYAVVVFGFTLIPGVDPQGRPWRMSFLHAFYFVSFLGTTIGLGEIPHPFSDAQRVWALAAIYGSVVAWLYAIGALFSLLQDPLFRRILHENRVRRQVGALGAPFYLVCGYDDAGSRVTRELAQDGVRVVVIDVEPARVDAVEVDDLRMAVPALCGDASDPKMLLLAGLDSAHCSAVLALTGSDFVNFKIALTARLLSPQLPVVCAAREHDWHARIAAAGARHIINPHDTFAERVALAIRTPSLHVIYEALTTQRGTAMDEPRQLPRGRWLLCGEGLFIRTLKRQLQRLDIETVIIDTQRVDDAGEGVVVGHAADPAVLRRAGIEQCSVIVAGTDIDIDNLSIALAARSIKDALFIIARQTQRRNAPVFDASPADVVVLSGYVIAAEVLRVIRAPQLATFLRCARGEDEDWAAALLRTMREVIGAEVVESWSLELSPGDAPGACTALARGEEVELRRLMMRSDGSGAIVQAVPLLLQRGQQRTLLPPPDTPLQRGDRILCCGRDRARATMRHTLLSHALPRAAASARSAAPGEAMT